MRRAALLAVALLALPACDIGGVSGGDSLSGTYTLTAHGGAALPAGGVSAGRLRLFVDQTIRVFELEWTREGSRHVRSGLYTVNGGEIELLVTSSGPGREYVGTIEGRRITVSVGEDGVTTLTFAR